MSAIGDYIHYTSSGYITAGTNKRGKVNIRYEPQLVTAFNNQRRVMGSYLSSGATLSIKEKEELEKNISRLMDPDTGDDGLNQLWNKLSQAFFNEFQQSAAELDRRHAEIFKPGYNANQSLKLTKIEKSGRDRNGNSKTQVSGTYLSTMLKRVELLNIAIKNIPQSGNYYQRLKQQMDVIYKNLTSLVKDFDNSLTITNYPQLQSFLNKYPKAEGKIYEWPRVESVVTSINKMINMVNGVQNLQKGTLFQMLIAFAPLVGKEYSTKELKKAIKSVVGTSGRTTVKFDPNDFLEGIDLQKILNNRGSYKLNNNLYESTIASQNKVDVILNWNGKKVNVSAKNLNMLDTNVNPYVHLVSQSSLLALMTAMNPDFVNHYINMISVHKYTKNKLVQLQEIPEYQEVKNLLKLSLLVSAFIGYKKDASKANIFIINDNKTGRVKIYDISTLVKRIYEMNHSDNKTLLIEPAIENIILNNRWIEGEGGEVTRIQNVLGQLHGYKISVKFKKAALTEFY